MNTAVSVAIIITLKKIKNKKKCVRETRESGDRATSVSVRFVGADRTICETKPERHLSSGVK